MIEYLRPEWHNFQVDITTSIGVAVVCHSTIHIHYFPLLSPLFLGVRAPLGLACVKRKYWEKSFKISITFSILLIVLGLFQRAI